MSSNKMVLDESIYNRCVRDLWSAGYDVKNFFPEPISDWINFKATILGVSPSYIAWPLLVSTAYCCQHSYVSAGNGIHVEPILLYGLVAGRSGKINLFLNLITMTNAY